MTTDTTPVLIRESIESGKYFVAAREWYKEKYLKPLIQRSQVFLCCCVFGTLFAEIAMNVSSLFPTIEKVQYSLTLPDAYQRTATVIKADYVQGNPLGSIADIMVRDYVTQRERYSYSNLKPQFIFIQNTSSRPVYKKFASFMSLDNLNSPVWLYKTEFKRFITLKSSKYINSNEIAVYFESIARNNVGDVIEHKVWQVDVTFEIDDIALDVPAGSKFNFIVTNYKLKQLEDKQKK